MLRLVVPVATMLTIGAAALLLLMTPIWMHPALALSGARADLPFAPDSIQRTAAPEYSDRTISELLFGPATFDFGDVSRSAVPGGFEAFYGPLERAHLQDVRAVLFGFLGLSAVALVALAVIAVGRRRDPALWRALSGAGLVLAAGTVVVGAFAALAFGVAFELFHRLLFPGGNYSFEAGSRLIQLYPLAFWQLTAAALGALLIGGGVVTWLGARRRARRLAAAR